MRLFIYFHADENNWWSSEVRTYNGQEGADWIYYTSDSGFFRSNLNQAFTAPNLTLVGDSGNQFEGNIYFKNLNLETSFRPAPDTSCDCEGSSLTERQKGNYNCKDGTTLSDLTLWVNCYFWGDDSSLCDYNCDGTANMGEYTTWWNWFRITL